MGNQLVGIAPSQIHAVEHYFSGQFGSEIIFESNMGSTRFFKVAKARTLEGLIVVKVFVKHDPTLPLEDHKERLEYIKKTLANAVNCLPFQRVELIDKAAYIMREFVKHSLYDRVSTRPFLTVLEKKWITFQILCALNQCHKQKICHGDIKLENILITSWNWILLSDFASYKPTYLPEDNPADYTYFFDTSRRRTCYIAPERFVKSLSSEDDGNVSMVPNDSIIRLAPTYTGNTLLPAMDIFSAGCALLELWTEGTAPFELSQLLAYRSGERELVEKHLQGIENERLRNLLASMIDVNSMNRKSAEDYLDQERGKLFPEYFYSFLQLYLQMFSSMPIMTPDDKIQHLHKDISHCIKVLTQAQDLTPDDQENEYSAEQEKQDATPCARLPPEQDGLILIITVVTSCIRGLKQSTSKIAALELLQKLSKYTTSETILDRILPYILHLAQTPTTNMQVQVQVQAIDTLTACLSMVKDIPLSDANVFPEYILPSIADLSSEQSAVIVRVAFAKNIAALAKIAVYFLEETQRNAPNDMPMQRYEAELNALHDIVRQAVLSLLTDSKPIVKQTLMESGICDLCAFFGKEKANDVILSHIMTFLNDDDKNLRGAFYDNIAGVAGYVGWQASDILVPLLLQGFTDREEFVIGKAIRAVTTLIELGHIKKPTVTEIVKETACFLCHPNLWVRHEICGMIATTARTLSAIDVQCKIMPAIGRFLKAPLIQVEKPHILLDCVQPPIPRQVFDSVLRFQDINRFVAALEERNRVRSKTRAGAVPQYEEMGQTLLNLFRRLSSEGLTDAVELQLLAMKPFLITLKHKAQQYADEATTGNGRIIIRRKEACHEYPLADKTNKLPIETRQSDGHLPALVSPASDVAVTPIGGGGLAGSPASGVMVLGVPQTTVSAATSLGEYTLPERNYLLERASECRKDLESLRLKIKSRYNVLALSQRCSYDKLSSPYPSNWRLNGTLVAHLHEHSESVIKLAPLRPHGSLFASGSIDGTVRLWDCSKLNGNQGINKSRQVYSTNTPIYSIAACDGGQSLAVGGKDGSLLMMRIDRNSTKMTLQHARDQTEHNDGPIVDMHAYDQAAPSVIVYATLYGGIVAWDTRMQHSAWRLQNELRHGVITTICADPTGSWLATGTSGGKHICWDLRFRLPIAEIKHPADSWIRKVACHPTEPSYLISASQSNNEVSVWNIESGQRQAVLWASSAPVLTNTSLNDPATTCGVLSGVVDGSPFILTGSSDQRIRYWDIASPKNSALKVPAANDNLQEVAFSYNARLIDGSQVIEEQIIPLNNAGDAHQMRSSTEENPRSGPDMPTASHHDAITDLLMCKDKGQIYIASASRDGVIKLWK
ncbi:phosphoinositide 3-kinase regulatory subunit 4 [Scaptodrosophila lebanonensis]|uniref:non-specific serine/threonine protein kinase n=1 Tax=Drosophila lebanonensis TaxID=7225 RepID=A0A6J2T6Y5_DROLE|nr:phosphoinositide 3-kinase regulatory subunit 4 [Scaptodrosophila lebanonensis]